MAGAVLPGFKARMPMRSDNTFPLVPAVTHSYAGRTLELAMNYDNVKRAVTLFAAVVGVGVMAVGCGTSTFVRESTAYMKEVATTEREKLESCKNHPLAQHHAWDHRIPESGEDRDCYLVVVNPAGSCPAPYRGGMR